MKPDINALQGSWNIVSLEMDGQTMPGGKASIAIVISVRLEMD